MKAKIVKCPTCGFSAEQEYVCRQCGESLSLKEKETKIDGLDLFRLIGYCFFCLVWVVCVIVLIINKCC